MADGRAAAGRKFADPHVTADGAERAQVAFERLETLWVNTGTLCNIECAHCYIESSPANDRLAYFREDELAPYLKEARHLGALEIGFTGGEPFMNPDMVSMLRASLGAGFRSLVLTNAMQPMMRPRVRNGLIELNRQWGGNLMLRVSLDHYTQERHDAERGAGGFAKSLEGLKWLAENNFKIAVAGRTLWREGEAATRAGFAKLFEECGLHIDAADPSLLVLFPEMDADAETPEITTACWDILGKSSADVMCATSRMVVKQKGSAAPTVLACTLISYNAEFEMGGALVESLSPVKLNHPHCSKFCVLGGASCSK